jgi:hypothetical protein
VVGDGLKILLAAGASGSALKRSPRSREENRPSASSRGHESVPRGGCHFAKYSLQIEGLFIPQVSPTATSCFRSPKRAVTFTLECSSNNGFPFFTSAISTQWAGTSLDDILKAIVHQNTP